MLSLDNNAQSRFFTPLLKLFEYAAIGVPVIVTRPPTTESLIVNGKQDLMCNPESAESMAEAVRRLLDALMLADAVAGREREWVAQYGYDRRAEHMPAFLDSLEAAT